MKRSTIKEAIKYWQYWLYDKSFTYFLNHKPVENINIKSIPDEEVRDCTYFLSQYDFEIIHTYVKENLETDCLSKNQVLEANENEQLKIVNLIKLEAIIVDQKLKEDIQRKKRKLVEKIGTYKSEKKKIIRTIKHESNERCKWKHMSYWHLVDV